MSLPRRTELIDALQIGAAQVWRAHPCVATPDHYDANAYISTKEQSYGSAWPELFDEVRSVFTSLMYQKWGDSKPLSFKAGMAIGLQVIDESHFFSKDALSVVHPKLSEIITERHAHSTLVTRQKLFGYAMQGFDIIEPQFSPARNAIPPERAILPGSGRNTDFELGVGLVLHAVLDSTSATTGPRRLLLPNA